MMLRTDWDTKNIS